MGSARSAPAEIREDAADVKLSVCREVLQVSNKYPTKAPCQPCDTVGRHTSKPQIEGYVDQRVHGDPGRASVTLTIRERPWKRLTNLVANDAFTAANKCSDTQRATR